MKEFHLKSTISQSSCVGVQVVVHISTGETIVLKRRARRDDASRHTQYRQVAAGASCGVGAVRHVPCMLMRARVCMYPNALR